MEESAVATARGFSCLIIEDDAGFASMLAGLVREAGGEPRVCGSLAEAHRATSDHAFDLLLLDNHLPDGRVYDFFDRLARCCPEAPKIMITGAADLTEAIALTRNGLFDYLTKPLGVPAFEASLGRALARMRARPTADRGTGQSLGTSSAMRAVLGQLQQAARHPTAIVLVTGESGVGKDVAVRVLHRLTWGMEETAAPYVAVNCAALPADMLEAELFGAERGAYTGADRRRPGLVAAANRGTLFLDEIGEVPPGLQAKLLRFLEGREYRPLGGTDSVRFHGRIVAATNRDLRAEVAAGRFREDLLFRIEVFTVAIPPLRERSEDLPTLAEAVLAELATRYGRPRPMLRAEDLTALREHRYPGNVRELRNILERSLLRTPPEQPWLMLDRTGLGICPPSPLPPPPPPPLSAPVGPQSGATAAPAPGGQTEDALPSERSGLTPLEAQEYRLLRTALRETKGGIRRAAARVGLSPQALLRRLEKWPELRQETAAAGPAKGE